MKKLYVFALILSGILIIRCNASKIETIPSDPDIINPILKDTITFDHLEIVSVTVIDIERDI